MVVRNAARFWLICIVFLGTSNASAQSDALETEFTIFGGLRAGGEMSVEDSDVVYAANDSSSYGLIWNTRQQRNTEWEVYFSRQQTEVELSDPFFILPGIDVDIYTLQLGGTYLFDGKGVRPYLAMTLGGTHVKADSDSGDSDTFFSGSLGFGLKFREGERLGFRLEGRAHGVLVSSNSKLFCRTGPDENICSVQIEGSLFSQFEAFAGVVFRF
jgi:hypothetical protein